MAEHLGSEARAQHVDVIDAVPAGDHRVNQGHDLLAHVGGYGPSTEVDQFVGYIGDTEPVRLARSVRPVALPSGKICSWALRRISKRDFNHQPELRSPTPTSETLMRGFRHAEHEP